MSINKNQPTSASTANLNPTLEAQPLSLNINTYDSILGQQEPSSHNPSVGFNNAGGYNSPFFWYSMGGGMPGFSNSEIMKAFNDTITKVVAIQNVADYLSNNKISIFTHSITKNNIEGVGVDVFVVSAVYMYNEEYKALYYPMVIESSVNSNNNTHKRRINLKDGKPAYEHGSNVVEVVVPTSDFYNDSTRLAVEREVHNSLRNKNPVYNNVVLTEVTGMVVPSNFNHTNSAEVEMVVYNAMKALTASVDMDKGNLAFNVNLARDKNVLSQSIDYKNSVKYDDVHLPTRSDINLILHARPSRDRQHGRYQTYGTEYDQTSELGEVSVMVDLVAHTQQIETIDVNMLNSIGINKNHLLRTYTPHMIITGMYDKLSITPQGQIMLLVNSLVITTKAGYILNKFKYSLSLDGKASTTNLGNIGYDAGTSIDFNEFRATDKEEAISVMRESRGEQQSVNEQEILRALYDTYFYPQHGTVVSMDIPHMSPDAWKYKLLLNAYNSPVVCDELLELIDRTLDGHFLRSTSNPDGAFVKGMPVFTNVSQANVLSGYYDTPHGKCDVRDVDFLYACAVAGRRPQDNIMGRYRDVIYNNETSNLALRDYDISNMYSTLMNNLGIRYPTRYTRLTFSKEFLSALMYAAERCGYVVSTENVGLEDRNSMSRRVYGMEQGLASRTDSSLYNYGGGYSGGRVW